MQPRVSIKLIAQQCGVSKATVSRALSLDEAVCPLSPATRDRIRTRAATLGYRPSLLASALSKGGSSEKMVELCFDPTRDDLGPKSAVMRQVHEALAAGKWPVLMAVETDLTLRATREAAVDQAAEQAVEQASQLPDRQAWKCDASWD